MRAKRRVGEGLACKIELGQALVAAGLHPATGGDGLSACSGDMLLEALVACAGVTLNAVATAREIGWGRHDRVRATSTFGAPSECPKKFGRIQRIRLQFDLDTNANEEQLAALLRLTERYCVVFQTLQQPPKIEIVQRVTPS